VDFGFGSQRGIEQIGKRAFTHRSVQLACVAIPIQTQAPLHLAQQHIVASARGFKRAAFKQ